MSKNCQNWTWKEEIFKRHLCAIGSSPTKWHPNIFKVCIVLVKCEWTEQQSNGYINCWKWWLQGSSTLEWVLTNLKKIDYLGFLHFKTENCSDLMTFLGKGFCLYVYDYSSISWQGTQLYIHTLCERVMGTKIKLNTQTNN